MRSWAKWTAKSAVFAAGFAAAGGGLAGVAIAGTGSVMVPVNTGNLSAVSGNQVYIPVTVPANVCGNAAAILGDFATAGCQGGASVAGSPGKIETAGSSGSHNITVGGPNVVVIPVQAAINACGNAIGHATAHCPGGASLPGGGPVEAAGSGGPSKDNIGIASGNTVSIPVTVPANVCGNAVAVLGDSSAGCTGGASVGTEQQKAAAHKAPARPAIRHTVKAKEHKAKTPRHEKASLARKVEVKKAIPHPLKPVQAASLGTLPVVSGALGLVQPLLHTISVLSDVTTTTAHVVTAKLPASKLAALDASVAGQPMSDNSLTALAVGALLTGAAALKVAGRGARSRKAASHTGSEEAKA